MRGKLGAISAVGHNSKMKTLCGLFLVTLNEFAATVDLKLENDTFRSDSDVRLGLDFGLDSSR
jgi:hypothetical protein